MRWALVKCLVLGAPLSAWACSSTTTTSDGGLNDATTDATTNEGGAGDAAEDVEDADIDCSAFIPYDATATSDGGCYLAGSPCLNALSCCSASCSAKSLDNGCQISVCAP